MQIQLDGGHLCQAPCWPVTCPDCKFGNENTTLEEIQAMIEQGGERR